MQYYLHGQVGHNYSSTLKYIAMAIFRAIGFGFFLIILRIVMPDVFNGLETVLIKFFQVLGNIMGQFPSDIGQTAMIYPHAVPQP
jgi:hypothetical protein